MSTQALRGLYLMRNDVFDEVYGPENCRIIERQVLIEAPQLNADSIKSCPELLNNVDILLASWGCPPIDEDLLSHAPQLRAIFYAAGSVRALVSDAAWRRKLTVVTGKDVIAERVAEFAASIIYLSLKHFWHYERSAWRDRTWPQRRTVPGTVGSRVGLVSLGSVGQHLARQLSGSALQVVAYDPYVDDEALERIPSCSRVGLAELFSTSDVVSLHAPLNSETEHMVGNDLLNSMKNGATLVNTARGGLIEPIALVSVLKARPDLTAVLDVTEPEPLPPEHELFSLPNVVITPHIAGNVLLERRAIGHAIAEEVERFARGEPLQRAVTPDVHSA
ncbi:MAG TPA: hydroxyacid dehydrogenase [Acidimicrobiales bacterium]|nr:hydroxyacid dehydrogenase [Acidimicrobiales bacterium]